ncbi:MAG: hypothetical protein ACM3UV_04825 [Nocardioidaceae bacterium]
MLLLLLFALVLPGQASAATVSFDESPQGPRLRGDYWGGLLFRAAAGEANTVTIEVGRSETTVTDSTAPLAAGAGCRSLDAHSARCAETRLAPAPDYSYSTASVAAELGDRDDTVRAAFPAPGPGSLGSMAASDVRLIVDGGAGGDVLDASRALSGGPAMELSGGPGRDTLIGGPRHEWLLGGPDADVLRAGGGNDDLSGDGPWRRGQRGGDLLDGGAGNDVVSYAERLAPVVVDLARGRGGRPGVGDRLRAIERVGGGMGRDRLFGDDRANALSNVGTLFHWPRLYAPSAPQAGELLVGRGGDDRLTPSERGARLDGGRGNDLLGRPSRRFQFACGPGSDTLNQRRQEVLVPRDCEWIIAADGWVSRGVVRGGRAHFQVRPGGWIGGCPGGVSLSAPHGGRYGGASWTAQPRRRRISFALNAAGRRAARRHQTAVVRAVCRGWLARVTTAVPWRIRL